MHDIWSVLIGGKLYCKPHPLNIATSWTEDCSNSLMLLILLHSFLKSPPQKKKDHLGKQFLKLRCLVVWHIFLLVYQDVKIHDNTDLLCSFLKVNPKNDENMRFSTNLCASIILI